MTRRPHFDFLVSSCVKDGGVYHLALYTDGTIELINKLTMDSPMYIATEGEKLYALLRKPFADTPYSAVAVYDFASLKQLGNIISTQGEIGCHISVADGKLVTHEGHGVNKIRQSAPHPHSVFISPDKEHVICCDLGIDTLFVYTRDLEPVSEATVPSGSGPRHLCFSKCGRFIYCINEMGGSVSIFSFDSGDIKHLNTIPITEKAPDNQGHETTDYASAAIKISDDGKYAYVTERLSKSIIILEANGAKMKVITSVSSHGCEPRDFSLIGDGSFAICANQFSNNISAYKINEKGIPEYLKSFDIPAPLCVIPAPC